MFGIRKIFWSQDFFIGHEGKEFVRLIFILILLVGFINFLGTYFMCLFPPVLD